MKANGGHSAGTVASQSPVAQCRQRGGQDAQSPGWPRLLNIEQAAVYLGIGVWTVRELINAGRIPVTKITRPTTPSAMRRDPISDTMRRLLIDRLHLDDFADGCPKEFARPEWREGA